MSEKDTLVVLGASYGSELLPAGRAEAAVFVNRCESSHVVRPQEVAEGLFDSGEAVVHLTG